MGLGDTGAGAPGGALAGTGGSRIATAAPARTRRVLVHDFAGHPFQIDLSRALARSSTRLPERVQSR